MPKIEVVPAIFKVELTVDEMRYIEALLGMAGEEWDRHVGFDGRELFNRFHDALVSAGVKDHESEPFGVMRRTVRA